MTAALVSGTEGYADEAAELFHRYEAISAAEAHRTAQHLMPAAPSHVLDIGSGTGRDAAWLAAQGPPGRRMFEVSADETIGLAGMHHLHPVLNLGAESNHPQNRAAGVTWTRLGFVKMPAPAA